MLLGTAAGFSILLARVSPWRRLRIFTLPYTEFRRSIPILIVTFFAYFGLPLFVGQDLPTFAAATTALALHASAPMSEVMRAEIESVSQGQWDAARPDAGNAILTAPASCQQAGPRRALDGLGDA